MKYDSEGTWITVYGDDVLTFSRVVEYDQILDELQQYANITHTGAALYETTEKHPKHRQDEDWQPVYSGLPNGEMDLGGWFAIVPENQQEKFEKRYKDSWELSSTGYSAVQCPNCHTLINI